MKDALMEAHRSLADIARRLAREEKARLDQLKAEHGQLARPDFLWHYLLQSFATMGRAAGWRGLIGNASNYRRVRFDALHSLPAAKRETQVRDVCWAAKIRMPDKKAEYILTCFDRVKSMGGPEEAKRMLLAELGRDGKIRFLRTFHGIGDKYARNIMMDVYHEDFRDSIAIDSRIKEISTRWAINFKSCGEYELFYLSVARDAGLNGWEMERLLFNFKDRFLSNCRS